MIGQPTEGALIALAMKVRLRFKIFQKFKKKKKELGLLGLTGVIRLLYSPQTGFSLSLSLLPKVIDVHLSHVNLLSRTNTFSELLC